MADTQVNGGRDTTAVMKESNGTITFANEVISTIAGLAAEDIPGVAGMSGTFGDKIGDMFGNKNVSKGIKVEVGQEEVAVDIAIMVEYGRPITQICEQLQSSIKKAIETMTGLKVVEVNVAVTGIKFKDTSKEAPAPPAPPAPEPEKHEAPAPPRVK